ncbi:MAG: diacylglycerol kinase family lipid kinase [Melioribacteraceae bacterium]|nr:diacylglycerol kinase family lipid kinase [Melioribacteraceae bacterium]
MKRISFIIHGKHLRKRLIQYEAEKYFSKNFLTEYFITKTPKAAEDLAEKIVKSKSDYLIAVGGDGTIHEVINGIMKIPKEERENLIVGLLPLGSGNDFARTLKLSHKISFLSNLISENKFVEIDVGKIEHKNLEDKDSTTYFINIAGVGLDAEVAKRVNEGNKKYGPNISFFSATIKSFLKYKQKKIRLFTDEEFYEGNTLLVTFANAKYFGSGLGIAPHAKVNDGKISVTLIGEVSIYDYLKNFFNLRKCEKIDHPMINYFHSKQIKIESNKECFIEADGEFIGKTPLHVEMLHQEIKFLTDFHIRVF